LISLTKKVASRHDGCRVIGLQSEYSVRVSVQLSVVRHAEHTVVLGEYELYKTELSAESVLFRSQSLSDSQLLFCVIVTGLLSTHMCTVIYCVGVKEKGSYLLHVRYHREEVDRLWLEIRIQYSWVTYMHVVVRQRPIAQMNLDWKCTKHDRHMVLCCDNHSKSKEDPRSH
jgi:hypothetical protein